MRPEITENWIGNVDALGPCLEARYIVCQHTQNLGVVFREEVLEFLVRR
jgi:hypothetical protein